MKSPKPRLASAPDIPTVDEAAFRGDRIGLDSAATPLRQGIRRGVDHAIDLAGEEVLHCRTGTAIGDEGQRRTDFLLKEDGEHVPGSTYALYSHRGVAGIRFEPGDKSPQVIGGQAFARRDGHPLGPEARPERAISEGQA